MENSSENIYDLNKTIKYFIGNSILTTNITDITDFIEKRKEFDTERITKKIQGLSYNMKNASLLSKSKNEFYFDRQTLIIRKQCIIDDQIWLTKDFVILKNNEIKKYKFGTNIDGIKPANDFERRTMIDANLSQYQYCISFLDNHINFLMESIKNVSDMTFGHELVVKLEEFRKIS